MSNVKAVFGTKGDLEIHRLELEQSAEWNNLCNNLKKLRPAGFGRIRYQDDEGDLCMITNQEELRIALRACTTTLRLFIEEVPQPPSQLHSSSQLHHQLPAAGSAAAGSASSAAAGSASSAAAGSAGSAGSASSADADATSAQAGTKRKRQDESDPPSSPTSATAQASSPQGSKHK